MRENNRLKKISDLLLQEIDSGSKWERDFEHITLELNEIVITSCLSIKNVKLNVKENNSHIETNTKISRYIVANVKECSDIIFYGIKENTEEKIFSFKRLPHPMKVLLRDCPDHHVDNTPEGYLDLITEDDDLSSLLEPGTSLNAVIPTQYFDNLITALENSNNVKITLDIALLLYSSEAQNYFMDYDYRMPRELLICEESNPVHILNISVVSRVTEEKEANKNCEKFEEDQGDEDKNHMFQNIIDSNISKLLTPLWVIAAILIITILLKKF